MNSLKNTALAILALTSNAAFAGTMGPICSEGNVTVPCAHPTWDIRVQALYLKPVTGNNLLFFGVPNTANIIHWQGINANWGWGFKLEGSYHVRTGNDINLNWYHYNNTTNNSLTTLNVVEVPVVMSTTINPRWDAINAEFGQMVNFSEFSKIRFHGGAQYAQISHNYSDTVTSSTPEQLYVKYYGFGPRFGADMAYLVGSGFGVYANGAAALLVGNNKFNSTTSGTIDVLGGSYGTTTAVVPEIEGKLGAKYTYAMTQGDLSLDVGYMWLNYINSQSLFTTSSFGNNTDFTLNGPYFGLKWLGSV